MYEFFYDESFHDRKISNKLSGLNIHDESKSDSYIGTFFGYSAQSKNEIEKLLNVFELKYKNLFGLSNNKELKGTTINTRFYRHGIASLSGYALSMYQDLFKLLIIQPVFVQVVIQSKTEYLVEQFLDGWIKDNINVFFQNEFSIPTFKYIFIKYLFHHRFPGILNELVNEKGFVSTSVIKMKIEEVFKSSLEITMKYERTKEQAMAIQNMLQVFGKLVMPERIIRIDYKWSYSQVFKGFNKFINVANIEKENVSLTIDVEENTYAAAEKECYGLLTQVRSDDDLRVRISDMISNFFGRIIYRLHLELKEPNVTDTNSLGLNDYSKRRHISKEWFQLTEQQYELYRDISRFLRKTSNNYWSFYGGVFFDSSMSIIGLILYIGEGYKNYSEYISISILEHSERCTNHILSGLYNQMEKLQLSIF
ncbi:MAG: hypothetical protein KKH01_08730 [Firmicutes bacterium]|nr:hypothetical protein [Bacillota bacterium]